MIAVQRTHGVPLQGKTDDAPMDRADNGPEEIDITSVSTTPFKLLGLGSFFLPFSQSPPPRSKY